MPLPVPACLSGRAGFGGVAGLRVGLGLRAGLIHLDRVGPIRYQRPSAPADPALSDPAPVGARRASGPAPGRMRGAGALWFLLPYLLGLLCGGGLPLTAAAAQVSGAPALPHVHDGRLVSSQEDSAAVGGEECCS